MVWRERRKRVALKREKTREGKKEGTDVLMREEAVLTQEKGVDVTVMVIREEAIPGVTGMTEEVPVTVMRDSLMTTEIVIIETGTAMTAVTVMIVLVIVMTGETGMTDLAAVMTGGVTATATGKEDLMVIRKATGRESPGQDAGKGDGTDPSPETATGIMRRVVSIAVSAMAVRDAVKRYILRAERIEGHSVIAPAVAAVPLSRMVMIPS